MEPEIDVPSILFASFGTAYVGGTPIKIKNGVIKKPPPTPNNPDKTPTTKQVEILEVNLCKLLRLEENIPLTLTIPQKY